MAIRLLEMRRLLKPTGSVYLHCDPTMSHYLKLVMDTIFGRKNFRNEIVWCYGTASGGRVKGKKYVKGHETFFWYCADNKLQHTFNPQFLPYSDKYIRERFVYTDSEGRQYRTRKRKGNIVTRQYLDESRGVPLSDAWTDLKQLYAYHWVKRKLEDTGYPTQKPLALLNRIIKASSNEGDVVFDPFCGCATTCEAADDLGRNWIGIDISAKAAQLVVQRIQDRQGLFRDIVHRTDIPQRTDLGVLPKYNSLANRRRLYGDQEGKCNWCRELFDIRYVEVDHIVAKSKGGSDHIYNLQLLCASCNRIKGDRGMEYMMRLHSHLRLAA